MSCECCDCLDGPTEGQNVFEITKEEFRRYFKGGMWEVTTDWVQFESANPDCIANGTGGGSVIEEASGCNHIVSGTADGITTFSGECFGNITVNYTFSFGISIELGVDYSASPTKYFVKYAAFSNVSNSDLTSSPTGYPANVDFTVDGNPLIAFGNWSPGWAGFSGYSNDSTATLVATFTPNEL